MKLIRSLLRDESGATAIEYGMVVILVSLVGVTAFGVIGTKVTNTMVNVGTSMK